MKDDTHILRKIGHLMIDDMFDYVDSVTERPTWQPIAADAKAAVTQSVPQVATPVEAVYHEFVQNILPYPRGNISPSYWGWVNGSGLPVGALADFLASMMNCTNGAGESSAMLIEEQVIKWMIELFSFPNDAGGVLTSGCSMGQIIALAAMREHVTNNTSRTRGLTEGQNLRIYGSSETHHSVHKALELLGLGSDAFVSITVDSAFRVDGTALRHQIELDLQAGYRPACIIGNVGTVGTGAIDDLQALAALRDEFHLWLHIDGAFGGIAVILEEYQPQLCALSTADSLTFDFHKWMYIPYDASCVLVKDVTLLEQTFRGDAPYITKTTVGPAAYHIAFSDLGIEQSRRFRALKVWFALKCYGVEGFKAAIAQNIQDVRDFAASLRTEADIEILGDPQLNVLCFRYRASECSEETLNELNRAALAHLQNSGLAVPSHNILNGAFYIRVANVNHRTHLSDLEAMGHTFLAFARAQRARLVP